jgi:hypothetical protein
MATYDYGALLSTQARRDYMPQRVKVTTGDFGTADWQGAVAASAQGRAMVQAKEADMMAQMASTGIASYGRLAEAGVNAAAQVGSSAISAYGGVRQSEIAADAAVKQASGKRFAGGIAALGMGIAPLFAGSGPKQEKLPMMEVPKGKA